MKNMHRFQITQLQLDALLASATLWLMWLAHVIFSLGDPHRSRRLIRFVKRCERRVECLVAAMAMRRLAPPPQRPRHHFAPPGFRQSACKLRLFFKGAGIRARNASLRARVLRLIAVLADPEPCIARFVRRFRRRLHGRSLIAARPPASACVALACPSVAVADSS